MMSGIGFMELLLLFVIGLLILGPERLPRVASQIGRWVGKARRTANQLRFQMEREIALADIERSQKKKRDDSTAAKAADSKGAGATSTDTAADNAAEPAAAAEAPSADAADQAARTPTPADDGRDDGKS